MQRIIVDVSDDIFFQQYFYLRIKTVNVISAVFCNVLSWIMNQEYWTDIYIVSNVQKTFFNLPTLLFSAGNFTHVLEQTPISSRGVYETLLADRLRVTLTAATGAEASIADLQIVARLGLSS